MEDGRIDCDTLIGKELGFTSDQFSGWLWKQGDYIIISFIVSKDERRGNLSRLFDTIWDKGYGIKVPTPSKRMRSILKKKGFKRTIEWDDEEEDNVEIWVMNRR